MRWGSPRKSGEFESSVRSGRATELRPRDLRILGAIASAVAVLVTAVSIYAVHGSLPHNPITLPLENELSTRAWAPQGWKFFTREPREPRTLLFRRTGGHWARAEAGPSSRPHYLFGLDRTGRVQGLEVGMILVRLPGAAWTDCTVDPVACLDGPLDPIVLDNESPEATLCGPVGLVRQEPLPWSWTDLERPVTLPSLVVRLELRC